MGCKRCGEKSIHHVSAKCSDLCFIQYPDGSEKDDYVPNNLGIGGGDYVEFDFCLSCGQLQGLYKEKKRGKVRSTS